MVLKKRLSNGLRGFQVPEIPRCPRSARTRVPFEKPVEDGRACAFELLASLAGKLLQESEGSTSSNVSEAKPLAEEQCRNGSCDDKRSGKDVEIGESDCILECISASDNVKSEIMKLENKFGNHSNTNRVVELPNNHEARSSGFEGLSTDNKYSLKDPLELRLNSPSLVDLNNNVVKSPFCGELFPNASFLRHGNDNKLRIIDDDEKFIRCNKVCTKSKAFRPSRRIARKIIRKRLTSKHWKVAPKLKDYERSRYGKGMKPASRKRKPCYNFERSQCYTLSKRKKLSEKGSMVTRVGGFSSESVSDSPKKGICGNNRSSSTKAHVSKDSHVKFRIKSFRIPELYVEVPETATVGSLKRTVMEAVMSIIGGGAHVGVLVQGKKVRDDNRTLRQTGISCKENLDKLGFVLEPSSSQASPVVRAGDPSHCEASEPTMSLRTPSIESGISVTKQDSSLVINTGDLVEINHESASSLDDTMSDKLTHDSGAIVPVPDNNSEALAAVPVNHNTVHSEIVQRRTRRPFSVSEVEALVHAVEEVGTGRWRDVKLRCFENADHRTYVDLKDKWKTLVHTAKISPQQRRGQPVPQELLDRVLAAHAFWSIHQAKHHVKHQTNGVQPLVIM
ncbi:telomere repeat-binding protein 4 isoform X2 [Vicia villosa]|uniref:telomere repeat-binding protein 4 isoform X2 n=1 Tax=Vicia villosa TaxID=3911 RepID=UPI00273CA015|nr:telomere repeat-binding protein 4 isoform X2 [Vicia villosa]